MVWLVLKLHNINYPYIDIMTLLLNSEISWAECLPVVIGGSTRVNVVVIWASFGYDQGTAAIFLVLYLKWVGLHHRLFTTQPDHLWVRISCQDRRKGEDMDKSLSKLCLLSSLRSSWSQILISDALKVQFVKLEPEFIRPERWDLPE